MFAISLSAATAIAICALAITGNAQPGPQDLDVEHTITGKTIKLKPKLYMPPGPGPHSVVVVVNSSSGKNDIFFDAAPKVLVPSGIAVVLLDTFTPRGVTNTVYDQSKVTSRDMGADALAVLKHLRADNRFKPRNIALMGHSKGGLLAHQLASTAWYEFAELAEIANYNAAVALSPGCSFQFAGFMDAVPSMQFFAIMGERDDYTPPAPCIGMFNRAKAAGKNIEYRLIAKASHSFSTYGTTYGSQIQTMKNCTDDPILYAGRDKPIASISGKRRLSSTREAFPTCQKLGASTGGSHDAVPEVMSLVVAWLKARGW